MGFGENAPHVVQSIKLLGVLVAMLVLFAARPAAAHQTGLSRGDYTLNGRDVEAELVFSGAELSRTPGSLQAILESGLHVSSDGAPCPGSWKGIVAVEADGVRAQMHFACRSAPRELVLRFDFLESFAADHQHLVRVNGDAHADGVGVLAQRELRVKAGAPRAVGGASLVWMGIEHILSGWDHLLFLIGLVVVGGRWRSILLAVTAFTVAHSITLGLAVLDVVHASPIFVEPAIALSVLYVGAENFYVNSTDGRWRITFPFGLIHGFGFASALRELELPRPQVPMALFTFNAGVEIGQLGVLALVLPVLWLLRKSLFFQKWGVRGISAVIAAAGAVWFVARLAC